MFHRLRLAGMMISVLVLFPTLAAATTYYIDFAGGSDSNSGTSKTAPWQRAPGMQGATAAYTHVVGDVFVFKGGVMWPGTALPLRINYSGSPGNIDTYTTDHTWFSGVSWSQPIFDGGGAGAQLITAAGRAFFAVNDLKLQNVAVAGRGDSFKAVEVSNSHDFALSNNTLRPYSWVGFYIYGSNGTTQNNILVQNNDISNAAMGIVVATDGSNTILDNVIVSGNHLHDFSSQIGGGVHGDGIHFWGQGGDASQYIRNGQIYNNTFSGSFMRSFGADGALTGLIFLENIHSLYLIYNNVMSYTDTPVIAELEGLIVLSGDNGNNVGAQIYNNSLYGTDPGISAAIALFNVANMTIKNNIMSGMQYCFYNDSDPAGGAIVDYNDLNCSDSSVGIWDSISYSFAAWKAFGNDTHGINTGPLFSSPPGNLHPRANSPVFGAGTNLSGIFNTDADGKTLPSTGAWTIGAYQGLDPQAPSPPSNLRIVPSR
jgi:hypothetical protein